MFKNLIYVIFLNLFLFSCKSDIQENKIALHHGNQKKTQAINFFDKKYTSQYSMIIDESSL